MRIFSKTFNIFVTIATIIVIVLAGSVAVANLLGYTPYVVESGSMEPAIPTGSLVFINKNEKDSVGLDDVVAYEFIGQRSTFMVTHRIVGTDGADWITKGDANENVDANPVSPEQIVGKYAFHIRGICLYRTKRFHNDSRMDRSVERNQRCCRICVQQRQGAE